MEMYKAMYYAFKWGGDEEVFSYERFFTSKSKALDYLRRKSNESMPKDHDCKLYFGCDLYCSITEYEEVEGVLIENGSEIFSSWLWDDGYSENENKTRLTTSF